jgi:fimbrial isopeptide formation D2 family protein
LAGALCAALLGPLLVTVVGTGAPTAQAAGPIFGTPEPQDVFPPGPGTDARLVTRPNDVQTFYAYTAPGEELQALFDKFGNTNRVIDIVVTSPSGAVFTQPVPTVGNGQWGFERGDLPSEEGIWQIELVPAGRLSSDSTQMRSYNAVFAADGSEKPGRVWTERLALFQPGAPRDLQLYFMSSLGYVYDTQYFDYVGINSTISADSVGNVELNPDGSLNCSTSAYQSFVLPTNTLDAAEIGNGSVAMAAGRCGGSYRVFFSEPFADDPAGAIPEATENPGESPTDWVRPEIEPPFFELTDYVGTSTTSVEGLLRADVDNFFGSVEIEVLDEVGNLLRTFTLNVPEGEGLRQVDLPFDGLDDNGDPIPPDDVTTFRVRGLNAGEIHFVLNDVEHLNGGMRVEALNGPIAGTSEATRIFWGEADNYDGQPGRGCNIPAPTVDTATEGVLSDPCVRRWQSGHIGGRGYGERRAVDQWARQGVAVTSTLTLRDPDADYTIVKSVEPSSGGVRPGETVTYTLTLQNVSDVDLWDVRDVVDDLSDVLDDADYNFDATLTGSWSGDVPSPGGAPVFDAAEETLTFRVNILAGETVTITYSVTVREHAQRGDDVLDNIVAPPPEFPPEDPDPADCPPSDPRFPCLTTTTPVIDVQSWKQVMADPTPVQAGTVLTYTLFFENFGGATGTVDRVDDLTHVIDDADVVSEPVASDPALTAERDGARVTVTGQLAPGQTVTVSLTVRVRPDGDRGDNILANFLLDPDEPPQPDPVCEPTDGEDGFTTAAFTLLSSEDCTSNPVGELAVTKSVDPASGTPVAPGDELDYTLTFTSIGTAPVAVDYTDHLAGLAGDATLLDGPTPSDPALTVSDVQNDEYTITGTLAAGQTATVTYTVEVKPRDELGDGLLENHLTPTGEDPPGECRDTNPLCTVNPVTPPGLPDTGNDLAARLLIGAIAALFGGLVLLVASRRAALLAAAI